MEKKSLAILHALPVQQQVSIGERFEQLLEGIRLQQRARKYQRKEDRGGIAYICEKVQRGDIVFDIGAHKAGYIYFFLSQLGNTGRVIAFEPQSILYHYLQKLKQVFNWHNVTIEPAAVSDRKGHALLYVPVNGGRYSSPCATIIESHMQFKYQSKENVPMISVDDYCLLNNIYPDFLKIDVEGNEFAVLKGAEKILRERKPPILFECEARFVGKDKMIQTFAYLLQLGYSGWFIYKDERRPILEFNAEQFQSPKSAVYCNNFIFE